jgi:hypothetical protein
MRYRSSSIQAALVLFACTLFLWMFFAAAVLERTADLGNISAPSGQDTKAVAYDFAARWRHGMAGNSPLYMPGFFAAAVTLWFWSARKSLRRTLVEGFLLVGAAAWCAYMLAPFGASRVIEDFRALGFVVSTAESSGNWVAFAQGVYSLLTWSSLIITLRWSIKLRSPLPLLVPVVLNLILAYVRPWTVADFSSQWMRETIKGEPTALASFLLIPITSGVIAWVELRSHRRSRRLIPK